MPTKPKQTKPTFEIATNITITAERGTYSSRKETLEQVATFGALSDIQGFNALTFTDDRLALDSGPFEFEADVAVEKLDNMTRQLLAMFDVRVVVRVTKTTTYCNGKHEYHYDIIADRYKNTEKHWKHVNYTETKMKCLKCDRELGLDQFTQETYSSDDPSHRMWENFQGQCLTCAGDTMEWRETFSTHFEDLFTKYKTKRKT